MDSSIKKERLIVEQVNIDLNTEWEISLFYKNSLKRWGVQLENIAKSLRDLRETSYLHAKAAVKSYLKETEETLLTVTDNLRDLETNFPKIGNCTNSEQFLNESEAINDLANNMPTTITTEESFKRLVTFVTLQESDDEEYSDSDLDDGDEILVIGESGRTKIVKSAFDLIKDKHYSVMSRYLLKYIHTRERYGIKISGKFDPDQIKDENRPPRRLEPILIHDIIQHVSQYCKVPFDEVHDNLVTEYRNDFKRKNENNNYENGRRNLIK